MLGWTQEHGPYVIEDEQTEFTRNAYSWNKFANVIYFDSPAGVGYSICGKPEECDFDDDNSADDNLKAFISLMTDKLPQLQANDLYIAGESYAGIYVPKLAQKMDQYITNKTGSYLPNLKGIMVGNPVTDHSVDGKPMQFEMAYWFGLIDDALYSNVKMNCDLSYWDFDAGLLSPQCKNWMNQFNSVISGINHYDFLGKCYIEPQPSSKATLKHKPRFAPKAPHPSMLLPDHMPVFTVNDYTPFIATPKENEKSLEQIPNCVYALPIYFYLNNRTVMEALHIPSTVTKWDLCKEKGEFSYTKLRNGSIDIYPLLKDKYKILVYSGNTDGVVPTYGTKAWVDNLKWPIKQTWQQFFVDGQVGGHHEIRNNGSFIFTTIHGAGHMAPQWRRSYTYHVITSFL